MEKPLDAIPVSVAGITDTLSTRIAALEKENAVLRSQLATLLAATPEDVWKALTNPKTDGE